MDFENMLQLAKEILSVTEQAPGAKMQPQVTILLSAEGRVYSVVNRDVCSDECESENSIIKELTGYGKTLISKMVTVWKDGTVDVSSMKFRLMIYKMNHDNADTEILLQGENGYITKLLKKLLP